MPKLKDPPSTHGVPIRDAFRAAEIAAVLEWRRLLREHADGRSVDLGEVSRLAAVVGVRSAASAFASDCDALAAARSLEERCREARSELTAATDAALAADRQIFQLRAKVAELERVAALPPILAHGLSAMERQLRELQSAHPRLWCETTATADHVGPPKTYSLEEAWSGRKSDPTLGAEFLDDDDNEWGPHG